VIKVTSEVRFNHIKRKLRGVKAASDVATDRATSVILAEAQRRAPRGKTLRIADGLTSKVLDAGDEEHGKTVAVGVWDVKEARFQETGTVKMHAHPYLRPASLLGRRTLKREAEDLIKRELEAT